MHLLSEISLKIKILCPQARMFSVTTIQGDRSIHLGTTQVKVFVKYNLLSTMYLMFSVFIEYYMYILHILCFKLYE